MVAEPTVFSNLQIELLKLYANQIPERQLLEIKRLLAHYFAEQATAAMDRYWNENGITVANMTEWANGHLRRKNSH